MKNLLLAIIAGLISSGCATGVYVIDEGGRFAQIFGQGLNHPLYELETTSNERCIAMAKNTPANPQIKMRCANNTAANLNSRGRIYNPITGETMNIKSISYQSCIAIANASQGKSQDVITCHQD
jgi:hypothetical protein